jgi:hypothetical protein
MTNPTLIETLLTRREDWRARVMIDMGDDEYVNLVIDSETQLIEAFREVLGALNHISQYDAPAKGGEYTKVWMRLGKKASEALARANEIASQALGETKS